MKYASDPYWGEKAAAHAYYIEDRSGIVKSTQSNIVVDTGNTMIKVYRFHIVEKRDGIVGCVRSTELLSL